MIVKMVTSVIVISMMKMIMIAVKIIIVKQV